MATYFRERRHDGLGEQPATSALAGFVDGLVPIEQRTTSSSGRSLLIAAAALVAAAAYVQVKTRQADRENPPRGRFIDVDGVRLHYIERGDGPPLVLLHGNGASSTELELSGLVDIAAQRYRVIVFDRPGFGYSARPNGRDWTAPEQADLIAHALDQLGVRDPIVLGHSWGTLVALALAIEHPDTVSGLVLVSGYYYRTFRPDSVLAAAPTWPVLGPLMRYTTSPVTGRLLAPAVERLVFGPAPTPAQFEALPKWFVLKPSRIKAAAQEGGMLVREAGRLAPRYHEVGCPVVIVAGEGDRYVGIDRHSARLHEAIGHSELWRIPDVGHMLHHTVPRRVLDAIDRVSSHARAPAERRRAAEETGEKTRKTGEPAD
jgi:pimeloyl-ACP methyl ester carboxylesterase